jgi:STE24 endopeptidase
MELLQKPVDYIQSQLAFIVTSPLDWKGIIIGSSWLITGFESYLISRQIPYFSRNAPPEILADHFKEDKFEKSQKYGIDKAQFSLLSGFYSQAYNTLFIYFDCYASLWNLSETILRKAGYTFSSTGLIGRAGEHEIYQSILFVWILSVLSGVAELPVDWYKTFVLEEKHGFNKTTKKTFITDMLLNWVLTLFLVGPIIWGFVRIMSWAGDSFIPYLMAFILLIQLVLVMLYPFVIQPLFNKLSPLEAGPLRTRIEMLADKLKFPLKHLYVIDGSKRSSHSNAYFYGLPWSKHIVLYDTLIKKTPPEEIEAVLAHELGHWVYAHPTKLLAVSQIHLLILFSLFPPFLHSVPVVHSLGFKAHTYTTATGTLHIPVVLAFYLFTLVLTPLDAVIKFAFNAVTRRFEYQADQFAAELTDEIRDGEDKSITIAGDSPHAFSDRPGTMAERLGRALIGLHVENLSTVWVDWLYSAYHHSHPTLTERLKALEPFVPKDAKKEDETKKER